MNRKIINGKNEGRFLVVGPPRGGFTLLLSILNILYRSRNMKKDDVQETVNHFVPLAADFLDKTIENYFKAHISLDDLFYSKEFSFLVGGPKWMDPEDNNTVCVRKYLGVRDKGDFIFIMYLPKFALEYDEVVHSHSHPALWTKDPYYKDYLKFASIRNPMDIIHSSVLSINALTSEYIVRCVKEKEDVIRENLALYKLTDLNFVEGLVAYLLRYLKEFVPVKDKYMIMRWEDLILEPTKIVMKVASDAGIEISENFAQAIWKQIAHRNLTLYHQHSFRKGFLEDWKKRLTNTHLEIFKKNGFNAFLREFGYDQIKYFDEREYTPFQRRAEEYIKKGKVHKHTDDGNLFTFAFNKTNIIPSKFTFKTYPRVGGIKIERSSFKDEELIQGFMKRIGDAVPIVDSFLNEVRQVKLTEKEDDPANYEELIEKYLKLFSSEFSPEELESKRATFRDLKKKQGLARVPFLIESYRSYNIVKVQDRFYGVPQRIGPMDLSTENLSLHPEIICAGSYEETKFAIDAN